VAGHYKVVAETHYGFSSSPFFIALGIAMTWFAAYLSYRFIERRGNAVVKNGLHGELWPLQHK
jgi:peptidoglycan/LPS O-acetylase OafA/YrhL